MLHTTPCPKCAHSMSNLAQLPSKGIAMNTIRQCLVGILGREDGNAAADLALEGIGERAIVYPVDDCREDAWARASDICGILHAGLRVYLHRA